MPGRNNIRSKREARRVNPLPQKSKISREQKEAAVAAFLKSVDTFPLAQVSALLEANKDPEFALKLQGAFKDDSDSETSAEDEAEGDAEAKTEPASEPAFEPTSEPAHA